MIYIFCSNYILNHCDENKILEIMTVIGSLYYNLKQFFYFILLVLHHILNLIKIDKMHKIYIIFTFIASYIESN